MPEILVTQFAIKTLSRSPAHLPVQATSVLTMDQAVTHGSDVQVSAATTLNMSTSYNTSVSRNVDLGRYRRGDTVTIGCVTPGVPDAAPIAVILDVGMNPVMACPIPATDSTHMTFALPVFIGAQFNVGSYSVSYQFTVGGQSGLTTGDSFLVIPGGDSGGDVISLYSFNRPEGNYVVAQLSSGRLAQGRNPSF